MRQHAAHQVALGEDAKQALGVAHQHAADAFATHEVDRIQHALARANLQGSARVQTRYAFHFQIPGQVHCHLTVGEIRSRREGLGLCVQRHGVRTASLG